MLGGMVGEVAGSGSDMDGDGDEDGDGGAGGAYRSRRGRGGAGRQRSLEKARLQRVGCVHAMIYRARPSLIALQPLLFLPLCTTTRLPAIHHMVPTSTDILSMYIVCSSTVYLLLVIRYDMAYLE